MILRLLFFLYLLTNNLGLYAQIPPKPEPARYVNDYVGILNADGKRQLEQKLLDFYKKSSNQIVFAIVDSIPKNISLETYTNDWFSTWGIGTKENNNGVLTLIAIRDRKIRIEVGYGLEASLTDAIAGQIIENEIKPYFKNNDYIGGLNAASDAIIQVTKGEFERLPDTKEYPSWMLYLQIAILAPFLIPILARIQRVSFIRLRDIAISAIIILVAWVFLWFILTDREIGLGFLILKNLYTWFSFLTLITVAIQGYIFYRRLRMLKFRLNPIYRLLLGPLLQVGIWLWIEQSKTQVNIPLEVIFAIFHIVLPLQIWLFYRQTLALFHWQIFYEVFSLKHHFWEQISPFYTQKSIQQYRRNFLNKMLWIPLFNVYKVYYNSAAFSDVFQNPKEFLTPRADFEWQTWLIYYQQHASFFIPNHRKILEARWASEKALFEPFAQLESMPEIQSKAYKDSIFTWKTLLNEQEGGFFAVYKEFRNFSDPQNWLSKSTQYQRPEAFLELQRQCATEFDQFTAFDDLAQLKTLYQKYQEHLAALEKELPKRNDLVIIPAIEQVLNKNILKDPVFREEERKKYIQLASAEKEYFEKYACTPLNEETQERLEKHIKLFQTLFKNPEKHLNYDLDFLKKQVEKAQAIDWTVYKNTYKEASIAVVKAQFNQAIDKVKSSKENTEALLALHRLLLKLQTTPGGLLTKKETYTYSSSSSNSTTYSGTSSSYKSSYSDYKDYSDYRDYSDYSDYSDSSFGGGSSGGGGASGSW